MSHYSVPGGEPAISASATPASSAATDYYLPAGLPMPLAEPAGLYGRYWEGTRKEKLIIQRNPATGVYQFPPQWITHDTQSFDLEWVEVEPRGVLYSWTRIWHPIHPALNEAVPYIVAVVELPHAGHVRMLGNLLGDRLQTVTIGTPVKAVFEHHDDAPAPFTLVHWRAL